MVLKEFYLIVVFCLQEKYIFLINTYDEIMGMLEMTAAGLKSFHLHHLEVFSQLNIEKLLAG